MTTHLLAAGSSGSGVPVVFLVITGIVGLTGLIQLIWPDSVDGLNRRLNRRLGVDISRRSSRSWCRLSGPRPAWPNRLGGLAMLGMAAGLWVLALSRWRSSAGQGSGRWSGLPRDHRPVFSGYVSW
jgi:hypothetical protein